MLSIDWRGQVICPSCILMNLTFVRELLCILCSDEDLYKLLISHRSTTTDHFLAALNWPAHRGTATAFPMAGFGLSAFFFSALASSVFPDDTSSFLLLLAIGTFGMVSASFFFLRVVEQPPSYRALPGGDDPPPPSNHSQRKHDGKRRGSGSIAESLDNMPGHRRSSEEDSSVRESLAASSCRIDLPSSARDEPRSLHLQPTADSLELEGKDADDDDVPHVDIRGLALLPRLDFWQLFVLLGILTGIGLMTIK